MELQFHCIAGFLLLRSDAEMFSYSDSNLYMEATYDV